MWTYHCDENVHTYGPIPKRRKVRVRFIRRWRFVGGYGKHDGARNQQHKSHVGGNTSVGDLGCYECLGNASSALIGDKMPS